jgi:transcriptional regulator with XRE-family HTH domain
MGGLPEALRRRRKELGLTLSQIADQMGVTEATVQRWESGNIKTIRHEKIAKLAEVLDVNPATLMGWDDSTASWADNAKNGRKEFYKIMMDIMDEQNLDIPDFARACNLSDREVRSIIIRHSKTAPLDIALKISAAFNISLEYLNGESSKTDYKKTPTLTAKDEHNNPLETKLVELCRELNDEGQEKLVDYAEDLVAGGRYIKSDPFGLGEKNA